MDTRDSRGRDVAQKSAFQARTGERKPMGGYTQQLTVTGLPDGYRGRWVNNDGDRIQQALNSGYIPHLKDGTMGDIEVSGGDLAHEDQWTSKPVGQTEFGVLTAYLMLIRNEWYEEHQATKNADIDLFDQAIQQGSTFNAQGNMVTDPTTYSKATIEHNVDLKR